MGGRLRLLLLAIAVAACAVPTDERPTLGISNGTNLVVTVIVNGRVVGQSGPIGPLDIDESALPPLPWVVEARTASGRLLTSMTVAPGQVFTTTRPDGSIHRSGAMGRVDLSCGRLTIWAGDFMPGGPAPGPGVPGDCEP
jgi:hypothetical protein